MRPRWEALSRYYGSNETPEWAVTDACSLLRPELFPVGDDEKYYRDLLTYVDGLYFEGSHLGDYLHPEDMAPARLGMGNIEVCRTLGRTYDTLEYDIRFVVDCGGGERIEWTESANAWIGERLSDSAVGKMAHRSIHRWARERREREKESHLTRSCRTRYRERRWEKRREVAAFVVGELRRSPEVEVAAEELEKLNAELRSWVGTAFDRVADRSDVVSSIVDGRVGLPNVTRLLESRNVQGEPWSLLYSEASKAVDELETILRSRAMRDAAVYGFGHRLVTDEVFESLGEPGPGLVPSGARR